MLWAYVTGIHSSRIGGGNKISKLVAMKQNKRARAQGSPFPYKKTPMTKDLLSGSTS